MDALDREALDYRDPIDEELETDMKFAEAYDIVGKAMLLDDLDKEALDYDVDEDCSDDCMGHDCASFGTTACVNL